MTTENGKAPEWILAFRRKAWAVEGRFLENERITFQKLADERYRQTVEARRLSSEGTKP